MIIEFSGIDGAGKSSMMDRVFRHFNESNISAFQRTLRSTYKRILANVATKHGFSHWKGMYSPEEVEVAHALEMVTLVHTMISPINDKHTILLTDTYTCRWLATAKLWGVSNHDRLNNIYGILPPPNVSIFLDASIDVAFERMMTRDKGDHILSLGNTDKLRQYHTAFQTILPLMPYEVTRVPADVGKDELFLQIMDVIRQHIPGVNGAV
ncbi:MAG: hypothetical protein ACRCYY_09940 [Trueperaceae bacterium]